MYPNTPTPATGLTPTGYQWYRVGSTDTQLGAGTVTYTVVDEDVGSRIKVCVTFQNYLDYPDSRCSEPTAVVARPPSVTATLSVNPMSVSEGSGPTPVTVTATLDENPRLDTTVLTVTVEDGTAKSGTDFQGVADFTITIAADTTSNTGQFTLRPTDDNLHELDETVTVRGSSSLLTSIGDAVVTIENNDPTPTLTINLDPDSIGEDGGEAKVTASLSSPSGEDTTVDVDVEPIQPATVADYSLAGTQLTIPASTTESNGEVTVTGIDNDVDAVSKTVRVRGTATSSLGTYGSNDVILPITDDDTRGIDVFGNMPLEVYEGDDAPFGVALASEPDTPPVTIAITTGNGASSDVSVRPSTLTFTSEDWNTKQGVTVSAGHDDDGEVDSATVELVASGGDYDEVKKAFTVTVIDDESPSTGVTLTVSPDRVGEGGGNATVKVTATLDKAPRDVDTTVTVNVAPGTASRDDLGTVDDITLTILAGKQSGAATFVLTPVDDRVDEPDETVAVSGTVDAELTVTGTAVTIVDNDVRGFEFSTTALEVREGGSATYTVRLATEPTVRFSASVLPVDGGSTDISWEPESLTFYRSDDVLDPPGDLWSVAQTVTVSAKHDRDAETDMATIRHRAHGLHISLVSDYVDVNVIAHLDVTVIEDETASTAVHLTVSPERVREGDGPTSVRVTASLDNAPRDVATTVTVNVAPGTASDSDFGAVDSLTVTIDPDAMRGTAVFDLTPVDDKVDEGDETVAVFGEADGLNVEGTEITIVDDDTRGLVLSRRELPVAEGGSASYDVSLASSPTATVTVTLSLDVNASPDISVSSQSLVFGPDDFSQLQTVTVSAREDDDAETDAATVEHRASGGDYDGVGPVQLAVTVIDDEKLATKVLLVVSPDSVGEGAGTTPITVSATLDGAPRAEATQLMVTAGADGDSAKAGVDFTVAAMPMMTIPAHQPSATATFDLIPLDDDFDEADEMLTVSGTVSGLDVTGDIVTLIDDDERGVQINSVDPINMSEGEVRIYQVVLKSQPYGRRDGIGVCGARDGQWQRDGES